MNYSYRFINRQIFASSVCYTLILENNLTKKVSRIEKSFKVDPNIVDSEFLYAAARIEMDILDNPTEVSPEEVPPEEALSDG